MRSFSYSSERQRRVDARAGDQKGQTAVADHELCLRLRAIANSTERTILIGELACHEQHLQRTDQSNGLLVIDGQCEHLTLESRRHQSHEDVERSLVRVANEKVDAILVACGEGAWTRGSKGLSTRCEGWE